MKEYSIMLHWMQGDEFRHYLDENGDNIAAALTDWAMQHKANYELCSRLAQAMEGKNIIAHAEGNHISFEPMDAYATGLLEMLGAEEAVDIYEFDDEDEYEYDDDDDDDDVEGDE